MSPESLLQQFEVLADAPGGVQRLREVILQLAVRGKLVPQEPGDEPASVVLERIGAEKERLYGAGEIRKPKKLPPIKPDEAPFELPEGWEWARFADVANIASNLVYPADYKDRPHIAPDSIEKATGRLLEYRTVGEDGVRSNKHRFLPGQILYSKIRPNLSKAVIVDFEGLCSADMYPIDAYISARYLLNYILSATFLNMATRQDTRVAMPKINQEALSRIPVPVPPFAEQHRIVEKVDQLMALCDELEERQRRRAEKRVSLNQSALHHFTTATDGAEVYGHWRRVRDHFDHLYEVPDTVAELRQAILQLAVRGKLVPQDPTDEPASVLLERIEVEKQRLYRAGKIRRPKKLPPVGADEVPVEVPEGWEWVRLGSLGAFLGGGTPSKSNPSLWNGDIPWVTPKDMKQPYISHTTAYITAEALAQSAVRLIPASALLMVVRGMILARAFPTAVATRNVTVNQDMKALFPYDGRIVEFLLRVLRSEQSSVLRLVERSTHGTCRLDSQRIEMLAIPLPPLPEQRRIVKRVDHLMALCDDLEARLADSKTTAKRYALAIIQRTSAT